MESHKWWNGMKLVKDSKALRKKERAGQPAVQINELDNTDSFDEQ